MSLTRNRTVAVLAGASLLLMGGGTVDVAEMAGPKIMGKDIANGTVSSADIKNDSVGLRDFNTYTTNLITRRLEGPQGDPGPQGGARAAWRGRSRRPDWTRRSARPSWSDWASR